MKSGALFEGADMRINTEKMFRFCANNMGFLNGEVRRAKINETDTLPFTCKRTCTKIHYKSNKAASKSNNVHCLLHKESDARLASKSPNTDKLFKIADNINSYSIFGTEVTDNCGIKYEGEDENIEIPSVTHILSQTMSLQIQEALEAWKKRIIGTFGKAYFRVLCEGLLTDGQLFHSCIRDTLLRKEVVIPPNIISAYFSVKPVLDDIKSVEAVEAHLVHPTLRYKAIVHCIARYRDNRYLIDWKMSQKQQTTFTATFDAPVQLAAYIGAVNASHNHPLVIDKGLVVVGYTNDTPASVYELNIDLLQKGWREWLRRLKQFYNNSNEPMINTV